MMENLGIGGNSQMENVINQQMDPTPYGGDPLVALLEIIAREKQEDSNGGSSIADDKERQRLKKLFKNPEGIMKAIFDRLKEAEYQKDQLRGYNTAESAEVPQLRGKGADSLGSLLGMRSPSQRRQRQPVTNPLGQMQSLLGIGG